MKALKKQTLTFAALLTIAGGITLNAQDMPAPVEVNDPGVEAIVDAQNNPPKIEVAKTAEQQVLAFMKKRKYKEEWDEDKERYFVIGESSFDSKSPSADASFLVKREVAVKRAILQAKTEIIQFVATEMSAEDRLFTPGTDIEKEFAAERNEAEKQLIAQKEIVRKLLIKNNMAEAKALEGVTWEDRFKALMDAAIKKLDSKFNKKEIEAKNKARYAKAKANYMAATYKMNALIAKVKKMNGSLQEKFKSSIETMAKMPLFGATVIMQAESWNSKDKRYEVALLVCWSIKLERAANAIMTGKTNYKVAVKGNKLSIHEWLDKQNLAVMSGPRQYLDADGNRWFIGISGRALSSSSSKRRKAKNLSKMYARQMAVFSLYGDVKAQEKAEQIMETRNSGKGADSEESDETKVKESFANDLSQSISKISIRGMQKLGSKTAIHPLSGHEVYVTVYGINPSAAASALGIEARNLATKNEMNGHQANGNKTYKSASKTNKGKSGVETGDADVDDSF